ncbi:conserved hypothetical protein [Culex quinquefasciatus]|uniref:Cuticle protein n=1 Tax=Culex quinquefasciatus TaxID=7176 RepID=B0X628_CULQU|nr:conserved hypothetical protein [Culex quinquefasciatus]|eukprot:XP_001865100.1 conserved hypothetical protein [Culex quinquefasciatus]
MRAIVLVSVLCAGLASAFPQQAIDPAYLRQYYQQIASQAGAKGGAAQQRADATRIYEQGAQEQQHVPQYLSQGQQLRIQRQYQQPQQQPARPQYQPQYQPQQIQYVQEQQYAQPKQLKVSKPRPAQQYQSLGGGQKEDEEDYDHNPSYQFGFDVKDDEFTNYQNRKEQREGNVIKGSYSVVDSDGFIRTVTYTADPKEGFKAEVSRQPTDIVVKIPKPIPEYQQQSGPVQHQQPRIQAQPQKVRPDYSQYQ